MSVNAVLTIIVGIVLLVMTGVLYIQGVALIITGVVGLISLAVIVLGAGSLVRKEGYLSKRGAQ